VSSQTTLSVATGPIFKALPNTIEGISFRLSDGTSVPYINNGTYRAGFGNGLGGGQEYDPEGIMRRYFEIDISNGSLINPRFYYGVSGSTHAIPLMSFSLGDLLFLGASKTQLYIKNITTNQEYTHTYTEESFSDTVDKRFFARLNVNSTGYGSSYFHLMVESSQSGGPYPYIGGNQPNGQVSNDALPLPRGNRSFEVGGLSSYGMVWYPPSGYPNSTTLKNGDIVVFNRGGDVVKIMSNSDYEN
jgi:hypothetical protein